MGLRRWVVNFSILRFSFGCVLCSVLGHPSLHATGYGFDVLTPPAPYARDLVEAGLTGGQGSWMRVRGVVDPSQAGAAGERRTVDTDRAGLLALRDQGIRTAVLLRWSPSDWKSGVRAGGGQRHPLDLREAFERGRRLGAAYGDVVDVWEIENEPDIDFVAENPETHAAFQKAVYLGIHAGTAGVGKPESGELKPEGWRTEVGGTGGKPETGNLKPEGEFVSGSGWRDRKRDRMLLSGLRSHVSGLSVSPRVLMAPLALPPGPYFERLWANGLASYTDGFNFHYYGYADDFTGVYRQFESAVSRWRPETENLKPEISETAELQVSGLSPQVSSATSSGLRSQISGFSVKRLPVFVTEYGYGSLDADARDTVEGRVRQWRWFASLAKQIRTLRPEGPMAFLLNPYYEAGLNEFGLTMMQRAAMKPEGGNLKPEIDPGSENSGLRSHVSGFTPSDFDQREPQPWMRRIGQKVGEAYASPALAYLWDYAERHPYQARAWTVRVAPPSPVVIDFVADADLVQAKRAGGYVVKGLSAEWSPVLERFGRGRLVLYNLGATPVSGELVIADPSVVVTLPSAAITLAPGERREVPVAVRVPGELVVSRTFGVRFLPKGPEAAPAVFSTQLLPDTGGMTETPVAGFAFAPEAARGRRDALQARPLASGEQGLQPDGRWLVTEGVRVEEREGVWRFHIDALPEEPLRSAMVELPLPEGFAFNPGSVLMLEGRVVPVRAEDGGGKPETGNLLRTKKAETGNLKPEISETAELQVSGLSPQVSPSRLKPRAGTAGDMMGVCFRTENGNLYQAWPQLRMSTAWSGYSRAADDFTMGFYGRAALPWRFAENRPASLVLILRSSRVPAIFEVRNALIVRLESGL